MKCPHCDKETGFKIPCRIVINIEEFEGSTK